MNVCILSAFRNSVYQIDRYFNQVLSLRAHGLRSDSRFHVRVVAVHGDSTDKTLHDLQWKRLALTTRINISIVEHNHGLPPFGSTESPIRMAALTKVMQCLMRSIDLSMDDVILYVESDLIWQPEQVGSIIDQAYRREQGFDIISPLIFAGENFYDIYCYRGLDGSRFSPFKPYHSSLNVRGLNEVSSVGSCLAFRPELATRVKPIGEEGLISWCSGARESGYRIAVDTRCRVDHP